MSKAAVVFDLDETLVDRRAGLLRSAKGLWDSGRTTMTDGAAFLARFMELDGNGRVKRPVFFERLCAECLPHADPIEVAETFVATAWNEPPLFDDAVPVLRELKERGYAIGIVSNGQSRTQRAKIDNSALGGLVDAVTISGELGIDKPDARIFAHALEQLGVMAEAAWFVGDDPRADVQGAAAAGLHAIWLQRHLAWPTDLVPCHRARIAVLAELLPLLPGAPGPR
ncbi:HAD family hydrolase [Uliginosibacterium sp. H1]|uniref:HAD family hydrolase n=1 Tax=Uliginosibacterium sp. H1 TaxID=3114757 RepID=UPI002E174F0D|nr:HAD family hydrolase [Uliginosibacterium sp. H1]